MKDFFDLALLFRIVERVVAQQQGEVEEVLYAGVGHAQHGHGLSEAFAEDATRPMQWRAFPNKNKLEPMDLRDVIGAIRARATQFGFPRP